MQVKTIVFDKTGTLTVGKPAVVSAVLFPEFSMEVLCDMAISVEVFCYVAYCAYLDSCKFYVVLFLITFLEHVRKILKNTEKEIKFSFYFAKAKKIVWVNFKCFYCKIGTTK